MSRRRKWIVGIATVVVVLVVFAWVALSRLDARAQRLADTGRTTITLLGEVAAGIGTLDADATLSHYTGDARFEPAGLWRERLVEESDGVRAFDWEVVPATEAGRGRADSGDGFSADDGSGDDGSGDDGSGDDGTIDDGSGEDGSGGATGTDNGGSATADGSDRAGDDGSGDGAAARTVLADYLGSLAELEQSKFKLNAVEELPAAGEAVIRSTMWLKGKKATGTPFESQARFRMRLRETDAGWKIAGQTLLGGYTVTGDGTGFVDVAAESGLDFRARHNPDFDTTEWFPERFAIIRYGSAGVSTADYDGDGWYDLMFGDGAAARLYRNTGGGEFVDATEAAGLPLDLNGVQVPVFADLDNDGDRDLFLGRFTGDNRLYRNDGDGTFTDVTEGAGLGGLFVTTAAAGDYDGDGLVDLYVGRYLDPRTRLPTTLFYTRNGGANSLLRNTGGLRFEDVTEEAGVGDTGLALGTAWADYDEDGDQDVYVANDFGRNALLRNEGDGTFTDVSRESGAFDLGYGMSADVGDVNNDGNLDLYVANVHSGQRWYGQAITLYKYLLTSLRQGTWREDLPVYREMYGLLGLDWTSLGDQVVSGNTLLLGDGEGGFRDVSEAAGANPFGWYWGSVFFDYDNDTRQDIYSANGWITSTSHDDL